MARLIEILLEEHRNIEKLLRVLEQELEVFDRAGSPDYEILQTTIEYFRDYPERYHHPKEDIIFEKLRLRNPTVVATVSDVESEHEYETKHLHRFAEAVDAVLAGEEYPRRNLHDALRNFIDHQRQHMHREEKLLFPAAVRVLRARDWEEIDARLNSQNDPLFNESGKLKFDVLRQTILRWEHENQANRLDTDRGQT